MLSPTTDVSALAKRAFVYLDGVTDEWIESLQVEKLADGQVPPDQDVRLAAELAASSGIYCVSTCCAPAKK
jgi:NitT/TauT family transport system substrate-binding protein